ncbi:cell wall-binding repeat-containing protein [Candidatus Poriferisodalis sp.]|uniref:cell wall-binding repeat-containing protein n=1 Tax=Candidatus Poriferisodalis sp. TaxID=3101277 RepID=UPI003B5BF122
MKIRKRRLASLAAIALAWCLWAPSAALLFAAPAQAANSASELLVDPDDRLAPLAGTGVRPFSGADRYETAVRLAERYAFEHGGLNSVQTVILASGEVPIDGAVAAGLSARHTAPILLTPSRRLYGRVADYLEDHKITSVIVIGGIASVGSAVVDELEALEQDITVRRLSGDDRFATAAAISSELDGLTHWCDTNDTVALLANGSEEHLGYIVPTGPLVYKMELPVLLSERDTLPPATAAALERLRIDRVVLLGSSAALSDGLVAQLVAAGVDHTQRINASSPESFSAAIARLMAGTCEPEIRPAVFTVALVGAGSPADGVAAGPVMGLGLGGSGPVPLLFVGSRLNSSVSSFLRTTKTTVDGRKTNVELVAVGGTAALSDTSMNLALRAATTSRTLSGRISAVADSPTFTIKFTEALRTEHEHFESRMRDLLYVNDAPALIVDQELTSSRPVDACDAVSSLTVTLWRSLKAGDVIEMRSAEEWFALNGDRRPLQGTRYTVPAPSIRTSPVSVEIIAIEGSDAVLFAIEYDPDESDGTDTSVDGNRVRILTARDIEVAAGESEVIGAERFLGVAYHRVPLTAPDGFPGDGSSDPIEARAPYALAEGDFVDLRGGAIIGPEDQRSGRLRARVSEPRAAFGVSAVRIGPANPGVDDRATTTTPDAIADVSERAEVMLDESVHIVGKWTGSAAGAAGNGWLLDSARASARLGETASAVSRTNHPAIRVWIDTRDRIILLRFIDSEDGEPPELTYGDFVRALSSNSAFTRHFLAELVNGCIDESQPLTLDEDSDFIGMPTLEGGVSSVSFLVEFSHYVTEFIADDETDVTVVTDAGGVVELIDDILGGLIEDYGEASDPPPAVPDSVETTTLLPNDKVLFRFTTADPEHTIGQHLSFRGKRIEIAAGIARGQTPDDPTTDEVDESLNKAKTLLGVTSRITLLRNTLPAATP